MNKAEFLTALRDGLYGLPKEDIQECLTFYEEMIDDCIEEGISEEEAVCKIGTVEEVISQIIAEVPFAKIVKEKISKKRKLKVWEIVLLALGSPIWLSLLISLIAVIFSIYVSLWAVIISLWSVLASLAACGFAGVIVGIGFLIGGIKISGIFMLSAGLICSGLSIFAFYGCCAATKGILILTKKMATAVKNCFIGKEKAQ